MKNPFQILGLTPDVVASVPESLLEKMIKDNYRTLQKAYHPDMGRGNPIKSVEINEAYGIIGPDRSVEVQGLYDLCKREYTKKTPQNRKYEERIRALEKEVRRARSAISQYIIGMNKVGTSPGIGAQAAMRIVAMGLMGFGDGEKRIYEEKKSMLSKRREQLRDLEREKKSKQAHKVWLANSTAQKNVSDEKKNGEEGILQKVAELIAGADKDKVRALGLKKEAEELGSYTEFAQRASAILERATILGARLFQEEEAAIALPKNNVGYPAFCKGIIGRSRKLFKFVDEAAIEQADILKDCALKIAKINSLNFQAKRKITEATKKRQLADEGKGEKDKLLNRALVFEGEALRLKEEAGAIGKRADIAAHAILAMRTSTILGAQLFRDAERQIAELDCEINHEDFCEKLEVHAKRLVKFENEEASAEAARLRDLVKELQRKKSLDTRAAILEADMTRKYQISKQLPDKIPELQAQILSRRNAREEKLRSDIAEAEDVIRNIDQRIAEEKIIIDQLSQEVEKFREAYQKSGRRIINVKTGGYIGPSRRLVGCISSSAVLENGGMARILEGLGLARQNDSLHAHLLAAGNQYGAIGERIAPSRIDTIATMLSSRVEIGGYLLSIDQDKDGEFFTIEGRIESIE